MKKVKLMFAATAVLSMVFCSPFSGLAGDGWTKENDQWRYFNSDSSMATECWKKGNNNWYYLNSEGEMEKDTFLRVGDTLYYLNESGQMETNTWRYCHEERGSQEKGWYYFGETGGALRRKNNSFKQTVDGKTYAFAQDGHMLTGWLDEDGEPLEDPGEWLEKGLYYGGEDGALLTGRWLNYSSISVSGEDSQLVSQATDRDYSEYDSMWMYFDGKSKKIKGKDGKIIQKEIGGGTYGFDENGVMNQWWGKTASSSNATEERPLSETPAKYYSGYDGGLLLRNMWFWMYPSENLDADEYEERECSWWHTDGNGNVFNNQIRKINGKYYAFDGIGRMQTGFVLFDGKSQFVSRYDVDTWSADDFVSGQIYADEKADLYFFHIDELNDGSMVTGKDIQLELSDGIRTFGFTESGRALGNRNQMQKRYDSYYINGLRLEANEEFKYGVVMAQEGDTPYYQVVDTKGKTVKARRKVLEDRDGGYLLVIDNRFVACVMDEDKPKWRTGDEGIGYYHYDKSNKENPYAGGLIVSPSSEPSTDGLMPEQRLNFD